LIKEFERRHGLEIMYSGDGLLQLIELFFKMFLFLFSSEFLLEKWSFAKRNHRGFRAR